MTAQRPRKTHLTVAGSDAFEVRSFQLQQSMSQLFEIRIVAVSPSATPDFDAIIGRPATFALTAPLERSWPGVCRRITQLAVEPDGLSTYELIVVPSLWLATQRRNYRMFQQQSDPDIALELLAEWGVEPELAFDASLHPAREYRVQYAESDFAFIARLLEDAGLSYCFGEGAKMIICDAPQKAPPRAPLPFSPKAASFVEEEVVTEVHVQRRVRPGAYAVRDHDLRRPPTYRLIAEAAIEHELEQRLERFHYVPGAFLYGVEGDGEGAADDRGVARHDEAQGSRIAERRLQAKRSEAERVVCRTTAYDLLPGVVFTLQDHPTLAEDRHLLVLSTTITGGAVADWTHECEAVGAELPHRPRLRTPKPRTHGVESATVVGPAGEEIHCDELGRVRVHFHWDRRSQLDEHSSCWIAVSQPWAGTGFGGSCLPRIGQEVLVDFLGGDPDRPVIVGRLFNPLNPTPYGLPDNKTKSGLRSMSSPGGGGFNELMFEDAAGREHVNMQAERNMDTLVKNDQGLNVGRDRAVTVQRHLTETVGATQRTTVGMAKIESVGLVSAEQVGMVKHIDVGETAEITVGNAKLVMQANGDITMTGRNIRIEGETIKMVGDPIELN